MSIYERGYKCKSRQQDTFFRFCNDVLAGNPLNWQSMAAKRSLEKKNLENVYFFVFITGKFSS